MCTLYLPSLLYAVISLLFNCPQSARAVVTDTLSLTSPPVNPNCELGLRVQRPHDAPDCRSPPARRRNATELTVNKVLRSQPGRVPWSDASDQQHRRTRRGLPRADGRARARASRRGQRKCSYFLRLADRGLHHDWRMGVTQVQGAGRAQQENPGGPTSAADGTTVRFRHVRAHAGHGMNERADRLAAQEAQTGHAQPRRRHI